MATHVTLRQLRAFVAVLETGSFSEASKTLYVTQAALSGLVKELESQVGIRLLDRSTRRISTTVIGEIFAPMARRVLADFDEALASLTSFKELRRGVVRVAAPEPLSCTLLPGLIAKYSADHPEIEVRFEDVPIEQVFAGLNNGDYEIGLGPGGAMVGDTIDAHLLWSEPLAAALRLDDPLAQGETVSWKAIRNHSLINYMPNLSTNVLSHVPLRHRPATVVQVHRVNTALAMLKVREGVAICPLLAEDLVRGFGLRLLPLAQPAVSWKISLFARRRQSLSPAAQSFVDFARHFDRT